MGTIYRDEWTEERLALLKKLLADRLTAAQIASELNLTFRTSYSRAAICGKINRLGLGGTRARTSTSPTTIRVRRERPVSVPAVREAPDDAPPMANFEPYVEPEQDFEIPVAQRKTLLQLTTHTCRWPVGDPGSADFYFCGGVPDGEAVYCLHHRRISYVTPTQRRQLSDEERQRRTLAARRRIATGGPTFPSARQTQERDHGTEAEDA